MMLKNKAYVTLVTRPSYLPGLFVLAFSLQRSGSQHPLIALFTKGLGENGIRLLKAESKCNSLLRPLQVDPLHPSPGQENTGSVAERFKDTFTKLRAFDPSITGQYHRCVFLDADMAAFKNPDDLFDTELPSPNHLAANHACVCNLDHDEWADEDWKPENCAYTPLTSNSPPTLNDPDSRRTYGMLNSGMFVYEPRQGLWDNMMSFFNTGERVRDYKFPDQDFLADFFKRKWEPLDWRYNALKTMRNWHPNIWDDHGVVVLHYIVDKPWEKRVASDGIGGGKGLDGETHRWWWNLYDKWMSQRVNEGHEDTVVCKLDAYVAVPLNRETDQRQCEANRQQGLSNGATIH